MTDPLTEYREAVENALHQSLANESPALQPLYGMMRYHLGYVDAAFVHSDSRGGKRLRPIFALLCCAGLGGDWRRAVPFATAIELLHNFSLIHDDIEDNSDLRHERLAVWKVWGLAQGINTGDAMLCLARTMALGLTASGHSAETTLAALALLDRTCLTLCHGQFLDIAFEKQRAVSLAQYEQMAAAKTAALLSASCKGGGLLAGADSVACEALAAMGRELGLAYQIIDDLLGIWGDSAVTGKPTATDITMRKKTYPIVYALQWEKDHGLNDLEGLYATSPNESSVGAILALLDRADARAVARQRAYAHHQATRRHFGEAGLHGEPALLLETLIESLLGRAY